MLTKDRVMDINDLAYNEIGKQHIEMMRQEIEYERE